MKDTLSLKDPSQLIESDSYPFLFSMNFISIFEKTREFIRTYNLLLELANNKYPILKSKLEEII
jgi:hypothetical protein